MSELSVLSVFGASLLAIFSLAHLLSHVLSCCRKDSLYSVRRRKSTGASVLLFSIALMGTCFSAGIAAVTWKGEAISSAPDICFSAAYILLPVAYQFSKQLCWVFVVAWILDLAQSLYRGGGGRSSSMRCKRLLMIILIGVVIPVVYLGLVVSSSTSPQCTVATSTLDMYLLGASLEFSLVLAIALLSLWVVFTATVRFGVHTRRLFTTRDARAGWIPFCTMVTMGLARFSFTVWIERTSFNAEEQAAERLYLFQVADVVICSCISHIYSTVTWVPLDVPEKHYLSEDEGTSTEVEFIYVVEGESADAESGLV